MTSPRFTPGPQDEYSITTREQLREIIPEPQPGVYKKQIDHLDANCEAFIAHSPFVMIATSHADGTCDSTPRGGPPGFMSVLESRYLVVPDYPGNRRNDSFQNILSHPPGAHAGMLVMIPGLEETLRLGGRIYLTQAPEILALDQVSGKPPKMAIVVDVNEAFIHCAKAFKRSRLWDPEAWPNISDLPSVAQIVRDHVNIEQLDVETIDKMMQQDYKDNMY